MKVLIASLVTLIVVGCAAYPNPIAVSNYVPSEKEGFATIVLSTGATESCFSNGSVLQLNEAGQPLAHRFSDPIALLAIDDFRTDSVFDTHHGHVFVTDLPLGDYYLALWNPKAGQGGAGFLKTIESPAVEFSLSDEGTYYLGEFWLTEACKYFSGAMEVRDQFDRDTEFLRTEYPNLNLADIKRSELSVGRNAAQEN